MRIINSFSPNEMEQFDELDVTGSDWPALLLIGLTNTNCFPPSWNPYLLVVLHIVAQTDQTGLELLGRQGPTVVLRLAKHPVTERHVMRMNQSQHRDGSGWWPYDPQHARRRWGHGGWRDRHSWMFRQCHHTHTTQQAATMDPWTPHTLKQSVTFFVTCMCVFETTSYLWKCIKKYSQKHEELH